MEMLLRLHLLLLLRLENLRRPNEADDQDQLLKKKEKKSQGNA